MTELHTIEVRYEDQSGRHVDVHEASRVRSGRVYPDDKTIVSNGLCACCEATAETTAYSEDNLVKVEYTDSEHVQMDSGGIHPTIWLMLSMISGLAFLIILLEATTGQIGF